MTPLISVITPVYNRENYIRECIESVLQQTFSDFEYILVDDCSTDNSLAILREYEKKDKRVKVISLDKNAGPADARNIAIKQAKGRYIAFVDSDDLWLKDKLKVQLEFMREKEAPISFTSYYLIDSEGKDKGKIVKAKEVVNLNTFLKCTCIGFSTSMVDREKCGELYLSPDTTREDSYLWIKLLQKGLTAYGIEEPYVKYRVHSGNISSNKVKAALGTWDLFYRVCRLGFFKSLYYFVHYAVNGVLKRV